MAIAVASVATTLVTGIVYADEKNGKPFAAIWEAIYEMELTPGPPGADGTNAITNVYTESNTESIPGGPDTTVKATCLSGYKVLGGGYDLLPLNVIVIADKPDGDNGWLVTFDRVSSSVSKTVTVYAICATP